MWIQVRTIDGTETQTIDDLSRLTKIECLREKIQETFRVSPDRQRLFYRGKQVRRKRPYLDGGGGEGWGASPSSRPAPPLSGSALCVARRRGPHPHPCVSFSGSGFCLLPSRRA